MSSVASTHARHTLNRGRMLLILTVTAFALILFRLALTLASPDHLGVDGGAYLVGRNDVLNEGSTNSAFNRLPLGPGWLLVPFTSAFSDLVGYKIWSSIFSVVPIFPAAYLLAQRSLSASWSLAAALLAVGGWLSTEMFVTGSLPLIGFGFTMIIMWGVQGIAEESQHVRYAISKNRIYGLRYEIAIALAIPMLALTNHTAAGIAAIVLPVWTLMLYMKPGFRIWEMTWPVLMGITLAMFAWPWYPQVGAGSEIYRYPGPILFLRPTVMDMGYYVAAGAFLTAFLAWRRGWRSYAAVIALLGIMAPFYSFDETIVNLTYRGRFLCSLLMSIVWIAEIRDLVSSWPDALRKGVLLLSSAGVLIGSVFVYDVQREYSTFVNPDVEHVLEAVMADPADGSILTSNFGEGSWYQGLTQLPVYYTFAHEPPRAFTQSERDVRCVFNWIEGCDVAAAVDRLDASYVVVNRHWPADWGQIYKAPADGRDRAALWNPLDRAPWLVPLAEAGEVKAWLISS